MTNPMLNESLRKRWNNSVVELARLLREFDCLKAEMEEVIKANDKCFETMDYSEDKRVLGYALAVSMKHAKQLPSTIIELHLILVKLACVSAIPATIEAVQDRWATVQLSNGELAFGKTSPMAVHEYVSAISEGFYKTIRESADKVDAYASMSGRLEVLTNNFLKEIDIKA